jgi:hypothetical protein
VHAVADRVGEGHRDPGEARLGQLGLVLGLGQGPGDAAHVAAALGPLLGGEAVLGDDVADAQAAPGLRTRKVSANTAGLSTDRLITQLEITTSTVSAGSGICSMWPLRNSTLVAPEWVALRRAS